MSAVVGAIDMAAVAVVVAAALAFLVSRFVERRRPGAGSGDVVVGDALKKGIDRARRRRR